MRLEISRWSHLLSSPVIGRAIRSTLTSGLLLDLLRQRDYKFLVIHLHQVQNIRMGVVSPGTSMFCRLSHRLGTIITSTYKLFLALANLLIMPKLDREE